jgi:ketosteroid isomerase-like protein
MSRENVEIVRAAYRAFNSGDAERLLGLVASDIEIQASGLMLDQGTYEGHEGVVAYRENLREVWGDSLHIHVEDFIEEGDNVVVMARTSARGKSSGAEVDIPLAHVWTIRAGKIIRFQPFANREEALETLGLSE